MKMKMLYLESSPHVSRKGRGNEAGKVICYPKPKSGFVFQEDAQVLLSVRGRSCISLWFGYVLALAVYPCTNIYGREDFVMSPDVPTNQGPRLRILGMPSDIEALVVSRRSGRRAFVCIIAPI